MEARMHETSSEKGCVEARLSILLITSMERTKNEASYPTVPYSIVVDTTYSVLPSTSKEDW